MQRKHGVVRSGRENKASDVADCVTVVDFGDQSLSVWKKMFNINVSSSGNANQHTCVFVLVALALFFLLIRNRQIEFSLRGVLM